MHSYPAIDWDGLRKHRTEKVAQVMRDANVDALVLMGHDNIRYATDFGVFLICEAYDWFAAVITQEGEASIFIPYVDKVIDSPAPAMPWIKEFVPTPSWVSSISQAEIWVDILSRKLRSLKARRIGVDAMPFQLWDGMKRMMSEALFVDAYMPLAMARQVKHQEEVKLIRSSAEIASAGGEAGLKAMQEGALDFEVLSAIDGTMRAQGAEFITHNVCIKGESQVTAGWFPRGNKMQTGGTMAFDWGCYVKGGYGSDMCRTGFVGEPPEPVQKAWKVLMESHRATEAEARPGVRVSHLDRTVNDLLAKSGYPTTPYSLGHGVGLRACELPIIYRPDMMMLDAQLEEGMVICLEPETSVEVGGETVFVKVEDMYEVTATGLEQLTTTSYTPYWED